MFLERQTDPAHAYHIRLNEKTTAHEKKQGEAFAREFCHSCTSLTNQAMVAALTQMMKEHPTEQQNMMRFCVAFIAEMSLQSSADERKRASVDLAEEFMKYTSYHCRALPKI